MIFEQLFWYNFLDNLVVLSSYWSITIKIEKREEREESNVSIRKKVVQKLYQNGCTNIISLFCMENVVYTSLLYYHEIERDTNEWCDKCHVNEC